MLSTTLTVTAPRPGETAIRRWKMVGIPSPRLFTRSTSAADGGAASRGLGHEIPRRAQPRRHPPGARRVLISQGGSFGRGPKPVAAGIEVSLARAVAGDGGGVDAVEDFAVEHGEPAALHVERDDRPGFGVADEMGPFSSLRQGFQQLLPLSWPAPLARALAVRNRPPRCFNMAQTRSSS